jgi:hypothetical protein
MAIEVNVKDTESGDQVNYMLQKVMLEDKPMRPAALLIINRAIDKVVETDTNEAISLMLLPKVEEVEESKDGAS